MAETPDQIRALRAAAVAARKAGDLQIAIRHYGAALRLEQKPNAVELDRLATLLHMTGRRTAAVKLFRRAAAARGVRPAWVRLVRGSDPQRLLVGFGGFHGRLGIADVDFQQAAGLQECRQILLWDPNYRFFLGGIEGVAEGFAKLTEFLRARIAAFAPRQVLVVGCSGSGYSALLYGHALGADVVHAFSPAGSLDLEQVERLQPAAAVVYRDLMLEIAGSGVDRSLLHLPAILSRSNAKTRYFVHYGRANREDRERAQWLAACPGVHLIEHNTSSHATAELLAGQDLLRKVFAAEDAAAMPRLS